MFRSEEDLNMGFNCLAVAALITDSTLLIDDRLLPRYFKEGQEQSIYLLPESKRAEIYELLWGECCKARLQKEAKGVFAHKYITEAQLRRCLCLS